MLILSPSSVIARALSITWPRHVLCTAGGWNEADDYNGGDFRYRTH
jgi:hypothetical protein